MAYGGTFVISLDFELLWGVRDKRTVTDYGANLLGVRRAIPALLDMFEQRGIACTWATVGFLFCADKDELIGSFPRLRPNYRDRQLSPYDDLTDLGRDEASDPYRYGLSLVQQIKARPRQEIASHTLSHFYCMEEGGDTDAFAQDLAAAQQLAKRHQIDLTSIVFPRNQISTAHLGVCQQAAMTAFRGNERVWFNAARRDKAQTLPMRGFRLVDSYLPVAGALVHSPQVVEGLVDIASSRFLRPATGHRLLENLRLRRIISAMDTAARSGQVFHLWWHPHNFGVRLEDNLSFLAAVLDHFENLNRRYGMRSMSMADVAGEVLGEYAAGRTAHG